MDLKQHIKKNTKNQTAVKFTIVPCPPVVEVKIKRPDTKYQLGFSVQNGVVCKPQNLWIILNTYASIFFGRYAAFSEEESLNAVVLELDIELLKLMDKVYVIKVYYLVFS